MDDLNTPENWGFFYGNLEVDDREKHDHQIQKERPGGSRDHGNRAVHENHGGRGLECRFFQALYVYHLKYGILSVLQPNIYGFRRSTDTEIVSSFSDQLLS